jgi:uncharacterized protein YigA (DUF484 family)
MSTQRNPQYVEEEVSEEVVQDFLERNPDFFENNLALLGKLRLPHVAGGTVSLVERQVSVLRQKDLKLERKLKELLDVARANDMLVKKTHQLTLRLLAAVDLGDTLEVIESSLRTGFDADQSIMVLFGDPARFEHLSIGRFLKVVERNDDTLRSFDTFLNGMNPRCGQIRDTQRDFLFGHETDEIGSAALVPLGKQSESGFLAIGSEDSSRFNPGMSTDFLNRLGELVAGALKRF